MYLACEAGLTAEPAEPSAHSVGISAENVAERVKRSCWQCYKLHWADVSITVEGDSHTVQRMMNHMNEWMGSTGHKDKVFCCQKCVDKFTRAENLRQLVGYAIDWNS